MCVYVYNALSVGMMKVGRKLHPDGHLKVFVLALGESIKEPVCDRVPCE